MFVAGGRRSVLPEGPRVRQELQELKGRHLGPRKRFFFYGGPRKKPRETEECFARPRFDKTLLCIGRQSQRGTPRCAVAVLLPASEDASLLQEL